VIFAAALLYYDTEVALYEDGSFVPRLNDASSSGCVRSPEPYAVQRFRIAGPRYDIFRRYAGPVEPNRERQTRGISRPAHSREASRHAWSGTCRNTSSRPANTPPRPRPFFGQSARAVSRTNCSSSTYRRPADSRLSTPIRSSPTSRLANFFDAFRGALRRTAKGVSQLLATVQQLILEAFDKRGESLRSETRARARGEARHAPGGRHKLKAFLMRAVDLDFRR